MPETPDLQAEFYDWKWAQASSEDGSVTVGLGTDIGPQAICYRQDLLDEAGVESDPAKLAEAWSTWDDFIAFGQTYEDSATKPADSHFVDSAASIFSAAVYQGEYAYTTPDGTPDPENSPGVQAAWGYATQAAQDGITAGLQQFSPEWNKAFSSGAFAAIACPSWMMGYIQGQAGPDYAGKWNIAPVLPGGGANWGGSWLGVPADGPERRRRRRPRRVAVGRAAAGGDVDVDGARRPLPVQLRRRRRTGGARTRRTRTSATRRSARSSAASPRRWRSSRSGSTTRRFSKPSRRS